MSRIVGLRHGIRGKFGVRASREAKAWTRKANDRKCWRPGHSSKGRSRFALALESGEGSRYLRVKTSPDTTAVRFEIQLPAGALTFMLSPQRSSIATG
jgi:hypothetical protein